MSEYTAPTFDVNLDPNGFVIDLDSLSRSKIHERGVATATISLTAA
jgi:hypothetical protein